ncbi:MAG: DMT family transporter [Thermoanaerobaculales bacterium]|nr:DMT family transporter [Thermoanaerobaculales bacterium]
MPEASILPRNKDRLLVLAAALLFSSGGAAVKACSLSGFQIASFRSGLAALALITLIPAARRNWNWRTWSVGFAYAGTMVFFVVANKLTTAANTIFLQDAAPLYILLLSPWLLKEKIRQRDLFFMTAIAIGMCLFFVGTQPTSATAPHPLQGNILAVLAGVCWAFTLMGFRWLGQHGQTDSAPAAVAAGNLIAFVGVAPFALPVSRVGVTDWAIVIVLGLFQIALAYVLLTRGMKKVPALDASLLLLLEPMLNPVWAFLVHAELPTVWAFLGAVIVLGTTTLRTVYEAK